MDKIADQALDKDVMDKVVIDKEEEDGSAPACSGNGSSKDVGPTGKKYDGTIVNENGMMHLGYVFSQMRAKKEKKEE